MSETTEVRLPSVPSQVPLAPVELSDRFDLSKTSVMLNGAPLTTPVLHQSDRHAGGSLVFVMGPTASSWGR